MRSLTAFALLVGMTAGAQRYGPPICPGGVRPAAKHPSAPDILRVQEQAASDPSVLVSAEPVGNIGLLRYAIRDYADCTGESGCYWADLDAQTKRALHVLETAVSGTPRLAKPALVLDIDETSLSSYCEVAAEDFGYIPDRFEVWITSPAASIPIRGTLALAARAQQLGVAVFFITGRPETQRTATEANLRAAGYRDWKSLSLKQPGFAYPSTGAYKAGERQKIIDQGYTILLNVGDQWSDLEGAPMGQFSVKLPNPFYYLP